MHVQAGRQMPRRQRMPGREFLRWECPTVPHVRPEGQQNRLQQGVCLLQGGECNAMIEILSDPQELLISHPNISILC